MKDRLWLPYAYRKRPISNIASYYALNQLLHTTYPHHNYTFEPQSRHYTTHGDLWDYVNKLIEPESRNHFLTLTLELGSWRWVKKRPLQLLSYHGMFNPQLNHRWTRAQRSHLILFDFMKLATLNYINWLPDSANHQQLRHQAIRHWYN